MTPIFRESRFLAAALVCVGLLACTEPPKPSDPTQAQEAVEAVEPRVPDPSAAPTGDAILARVGPLEIRLQELLALSLPDEAGATPVRKGDSALEIRKRIRRDNLENMIKRRLLVLGSAAHPEWVTDASWEAEVQKQLAAMGPSEIEKKRALAGLGKDEFLDQFRKHVREEMMKAEILKREVAAKAIPSEVEIEARYDRDRETVYHRPNAWMVYQTVLTVTSEDPSDWTQSEQALEKVRLEATRTIGNATDPVDRGDALVEFFKRPPEGLLLRFARAVLYDLPEAKFDGAFAEKVKQSKPGDLSPVFRLAGDQDIRGYCFFFTESIIEEEYAPFERVRASLEKKMIAENQERLENELFEKLRREHPVTIEEDLLFRDLESSSQEAGKS